MRRCELYEQQYVTLDTSLPAAGGGVNCRDISVNLLYLQLETVRVAGTSVLHFTTCSLRRCELYEQQYVTLDTTLPTAGGGVSCLNSNTLHWTLHYQQLEAL